jgi:chitodextrinase
MSTGASTTVEPLADAYVDASNPTGNYGNSTALRVDGSPVRTAYLRFDVEGVSDIASATLRVYAETGAASGFDVRSVADDSWDGASLTYATAPPTGDVAARSGPVSAGTWVDLDVSALVTGNGLASLALTTDGSTAIRLASSESADPPQLVVSEATSSGDTEAPATPANLAAPSIEAYEVDLSWQASDDNVAVAGYTVYRDGTPIATVEDGTLAYADTSVSPQTSYQYTVDAYDTSGNHSGPSNVVDLATPHVPSVLVFAAEADAYVNADKPDANYGSASSLRIDASPDVRSYVRFTVQGITGEVTQATLYLQANSSSGAGFSVRNVADNSWGEGTITHTNAPAVGSVIRSSGPVSTGSIAIDVSPLVTGNGTYTIALTTPGSTAISFASREGGDTPELSVTQGAAGEPPPAPAPPIADATGPYQVSMQWDSVGGHGVGVAGYTIYRDGNPIATVEDGTYVYADTTVLPDTTYAYALDAYDAAGNHSALSNAVSVTTPPLPSTYSLYPDADAYVRADTPDTNYGSSAELRVDGSPEVRSYLRFTVKGLTADTTVKRATLRLHASKHSSYVWSEAHGVADAAWDEGTLTYANAPAFGGVVGASETFSSSVDEIDVTPLVTGNGAFSVALTTPGSTRITYASRETGAQPELVIETGTPAPMPTGTLFSDGFETGDLAQWHQTDLGLVATQDIVKDGSWAARATSTAGEHAWATAPLAGTVLEATYRTWFDVVSQGANTFYLLGAKRDVSQSSGVSVYLTATGMLATRNILSVGGGSQTSTTSVGPGWHLLELHVVVGGPSGSLIEVWLDGVLAVTRTDSLGSDPLGAIEIGDRGGHVGDVVFDDVEVTTP